MKNVIRNEKIVNHNVEPYRFKVLSSIASNANDTLEEVQEVETQEVATHGEELEETKEKVLEESSSKPMIEDSFVEKLLEKTDELSSNIIKLQMQIENQEEEFEKRLQEDIQKAKESGIKEGQEKAMMENEEKIATLQKQYLRSVEVLNSEYMKFQDFMKKSEQELSEIAIDVSKEVVQKEISKESKEVALSLAKALIKELQDATKIEIKVNGEDLAYLKEAYESEESIKISADDAIAKGGVIILSDVGNLDGSIDVRFKKIKQIAQE